MGRPHAESDSYYAAHYNRCVKEEGERKGKTSADGRGMSLSAAAPARRPSPSPPPPPPQSGGSSKNFCLTMTISRQQRNGPHQLLQGAPLSPRETHCAVGHARLTRSILKPNYQRNPCNGGIAFHRFDPIKLFRVFSSQGAIF